MPDKRDYLVRTWSVPEERESVEVTYRTAVNMAKRVKRNAARTGDNHPSAKRMKREVQAVDDWMKVMQSKEWPLSQYVVGPIKTSTAGRDDGAGNNVDDGGANDQPFHDDFGCDDYGGGDDVRNENAPPNMDGGHANTEDLGDSGDTRPSSLPEESRAAGVRPAAQRHPGAGALV